MEIDVWQLRQYRRGRKCPAGTWRTALARTLCIGYFITLYWLLLAAEPIRLLRSRPDLFEPLGDASVVGHLLGFTLLTLLALIPRWPVPRWAVVLCLIGCAVGTEPLQTLVPERTPEIVDCLQNLAGIAIGGAICWLAAQVFPAAPPTDRIRAVSSRLSVARPARGPTR